MLWKPSDYTTCTCQQDDEEESYEDFMASTRMLGSLIIYGVMMLLGAGISCGCWWLTHRGA